MIFKLPYGKETVEYKADDKNCLGSLVSELHHYVPTATPSELVEKALAEPLGSLPLAELAKGKKNIVLIASDHTRPVPSKVIIPPMLREIRRGNPDADITILIATGCHRGTTEDELRAKFGDKIFDEEKIVVHDCDDTENLVNMGTLPSGGRFILNRLAAEADLLVSEGFIEPHFFAGFSGGRKSVLPGVCARETVMYNHNAGFINDPNARTGILDENPIHRDMIYAAKAAKLAFIVNVVINAEKEAIFAVAGDVDEAHRKGCEFLNSKCRVKARPADIVITTNGGYPLDQNIYQAVKGMTAAEATVKKNGIIVMLAKSNDGHGGVSFYNTFKNQKDLNAMMEGFLATPPEKTVVDQWQSQIFARVMMKARVIYVSDAPDDMIKDLHMIPAGSVDEAMELAVRMSEKESPEILVIPDGVSVIVEK